MDHKVVNQGVLVVLGVRDDGFREILGIEVADTESEATYQELFRSLKRRGLSGVKLVVSDDHGVPLCERMLASDFFRIWFSRDSCPQKRSNSAILA